MELASAVPQKVGVVSLVTSSMFVGGSPVTPLSLPARPSPATFGVPKETGGGTVSTVICKAAL